MTEPRKETYDELRNRLGRPPTRREDRERPRMAHLRWALGMMFRSTGTERAFWRENVRVHLTNLRAFREKWEADEAAYRARWEGRPTPRWTPYGYR